MEQPFAGGEAINSATYSEPADSPNTVTLPRSPPKRADVLLYPLQRSNKIRHVVRAGAAMSRLARQFRMRECAKMPNR